MIEWLLGLKYSAKYHAIMEQFDPFAPRMPEEDFEEYLRICQEIYLDMLHEKTWPWSEDSPNSEDLLESEDT